MKSLAMNLIRDYLPMALYWYMSWIDKNADIIFMNYGFGDPEQKIDLLPEEESHRYSIQLYHHMTESINFRNKDVVEVGCGKGGGLSYIVKQWSPKSAIGIDLCKKAVKFCNSYHKSKGLKFLHGDSQFLPLGNESCDIVINVESSHRYEKLERFLSEVYRVLRHGGLFLYADYRVKNKLPDLLKLMESVSLKMVKEEYINRQVICALQMDWDRKCQLYKKFVPSFLHNIGLEYARKIKSELVKKFHSGRKIYFNYLLQKH